MTIAFENKSVTDIYARVLAKTPSPLDQEKVKKIFENQAKSDGNDI